MKVIESIWFNNIGIVKALDESGSVVFFIGAGYGFSQQADEQKILNWGSRFHPGDAFFRTDH